MIILVAICGLIAGAVAGVVAGIGFGYVWVALTNPSCLGQRCGDVAFFLAVPIAALVCAVAGAIILTWIVVRGRAKSSSDPRQAGGAS